VERMLNRFETKNFRIVRVFVFGSFIFITSGCGVVSSFIKSGLSKSSIDFEKTEIISSGKAISDGISQLTIAVQLKNSDNSTVPNFKPSYEVVSGSEVVTNQCTTSLDNGMSYCLIQSSKPGYKRIRLTNGKVGLQKEIEFIPKPLLSGFSSLSSGGAVQSKTADGYSVSSVSGEATKDTKLTTSDGYNVFVGTHGLVVSDK
jgi:hypothetical protein